ncbi:MAG: serine/threonine protein kinase [Myxococcaceae bacterium]|nr:serine/threonine protein kinase [Myxococcaceae bacterium]
MDSPTRPDSDATTLTPSEARALRKTWSPPQPGTPVGRYLVREPIGSGGMGHVVSAWDPELARPVALKFVGRVDKGGEQERLQREAQAMAQLKHPGVVPVYDVGVWEGRVFLAMELVDGENLKDWADAHPRAVHEVIDLLCQVGAALQAAHAAGIVHRDVKPANVLVDKDGRARITDFGVARVQGDETRQALTPVKGPIGDDTASGRIVGTIGYVAPETMYGALATPAADQFALAVTAWQLLTGVLPFLQTVDTACAEQMGADGLRPREAARVPRRIRKVLLRGLRGDPSRRYPSVRAFADALAPPPPTSRARWAIRIAAAMVLVPAYLLLLGYGLTRYAMSSVVDACRSRAMYGSLEFWSPSRVMHVSQVFGQRPSAVAEAYVERWRDASLGACLTKDLMQRPSRVAQAQRDCLDGHISKLDERLRALEAAGATASEVDAQLRELEDPRACVDHWSGETGAVAPWPPPVL